MESLYTLAFSLDGSPWCNTSQEINTNGLQLSLDGSPWCCGYITSQNINTSGNVKRILKVDWVHVKTIINVEG